MRRSKLMASLGSLGMLVFNALRFVENNSVEIGLAWIQEGKFCCYSSIVKIDVTARVVFHEFVKPLQLLSYCTIRCQYNVVFEDLIGRRLFVVIYKHGQSMRCPRLFIYFFLPLTNQGQRANNQVGLQKKLC